MLELNRRVATKVCGLCTKANLFSAAGAGAVRAAVAYANIVSLDFLHR